MADLTVGDITSNILHSSAQFIVGTVLGTFTDSLFSMGKNPDKALGKMQSRLDQAWSKEAPINVALEAIAQIVVGGIITGTVNVATSKLTGNTTTDENGGMVYIISFYVAQPMLLSKLLYVSLSLRDGLNSIFFTKPSAPSKKGGKTHTIESMNQAFHKL